METTRAEIVTRWSGKLKYCLPLTDTTNHGGPKHAVLPPTVVAAPAGEGEAPAEGEAPQAALAAAAPTFYTLESTHANADGLDV